MYSQFEANIRNLRQGTYENFGNIHNRKAKKSDTKKKNIRKTDC